MEPGNLDTSGATSVMDCAAEAVRGPPDFPGVVLLPEVPDSFLFPITPTDPGWVEALTEVESTLKVANIDCGTCGCIQKRVHFTGRTAKRPEIHFDPPLFLIIAARFKAARPHL